MIRVVVAPLGPPSVNIQITSKELKVRYQQDLMLWRTPVLRAGLFSLFVLYILSPIIWESFTVTKFLDDIGLTLEDETDISDFESARSSQGGVLSI